MMQQAQDLGCFNLHCDLKPDCARAAKSPTDNRYSKIAVFHPKRDGHKQMGQLFCINFKPKKQVKNVKN